MKVLKGGKCIVYQIFQRKKPFSLIYDMRIYLRNEFHFSGVHGAMNRSGSRAK